MHKHFDYIDGLKGWAILLVVIGHSIQGTVTNFDNNIIFRVIYSFHMPMFMFLSGMVARYSSNDSWFIFLKKRFTTLVVPFVAWYVINYLITGIYRQVGLYEYVKRLILSPDWGLWFLWVLFVNYCFLVLNIKMEKGLGAFSFIVTYFLIKWLPTDLAGLGLVKIYYVFFVLGYVVMKYRDKLQYYWDKCKLVTLILFPGFVIHWYRIGYFDFGNNLQSILSQLKIGFLYEYVFLILNLIMVMCGIGLSYLLFKLFEKSLLGKVLIFLGTYTLDIYVTNQLFSNVGIGSGFLKIASSTIFAILFSLTISFILLRRVDLLNTLLLGGRKIDYDHN